MHLEGNLKSTELYQTSLKPPFPLGTVNLITKPMPQFVVIYILIAVSVVVYIFHVMKSLAVRG